MQPRDGAGGAQQRYTSHDAEPLATYADVCRLASVVVGLENELSLMRRQLTILMGLIPARPRASAVRAAAAAARVVAGSRAARVCAQRT